MDYLVPIAVSQDIKEVSEKDWEMLLTELVENSVYELVILDVSESIQGLYRILERCDRIYMPVLEDPVSQMKMNRYDNNLRQLNMEKLERKTTRFVMPERVEDYARIRAKEEMR